MAERLKAWSPGVWQPEMTGWYNGPHAKTLESLFDAHRDGDPRDGHGPSDSPERPRQGRRQESSSQESQSADAGELHGSDADLSRRARRREPRRLQLLPRDGPLARHQAYE